MRRTAMVSHAIQTLVSDVITEVRAASSSSALALRPGRRWCQIIWPPGALSKPSAAGNPREPRCRDSVRDASARTRGAGAFAPALGWSFQWWRGEDLNLRPSGYEPDELPDCSTPRRRGHPTWRTGRPPRRCIDPASRLQSDRGQRAADRQPCYSVCAVGGGGGGEAGSAAFGGGGGAGAADPSPAGVAVGAAAADSGARVIWPCSDS